MAIVFKTPKTALNTTSGAIQIKNGDNLQEKSVTYNQEGEFTVVPDPGMYGLSKVDITIDVPSDVHNQTATVDPSTSQQVVEPEEGYTGLSSVTVNAVTSAIDQNIAAGNIKKDVSILGVTGSYDPQPNLSNLNITPSTNAQEFNPAISGVDGYSLVRVNAVTSSIDNNISAGNIKKDVTILGVTGDYDPQPNLQSKTITPTTAIAGYTPDQGYDGFSYVQVNGVTSAIDANIQAGNIKDGVTILGVTGSYDPQPNLQSITVNPKIHSFAVTPESGYDGLSSVNVNAVTSAIDDNIAAGNIKSGVSILGVTGNVVEANFEPNKEFFGEMTGIYVVTPQSGYNGFDEVQITVTSDPIGSFWSPFDCGDQGVLEDIYNLNEGEYFYASAFFGMEVESGSIDSETGYYIAEDANGNSFAIAPYFENPDFDPENPDPNVPERIFPENFDLSGLNIQVEAESDDVTVNKDETDPLTPVYTVEISECYMAGINWNGDSDTWEQCYFPPAL